MNDRYGCTANAAGKKEILSSAARALILGLALLLPGAAALATPGTPISGIPVGLEGDPEGIRVGTTTTDKNGAFSFGKLPAGKYKIILDGQRVQTLSIGANGSISGDLGQGADGSASLRVNGRTLPVVLGPASAVVTTRSNIKRPSIAAGKEPPPDEPAGAPVVTSRSNKKAGIAKGEVPPPVVGPSTSTITRDGTQLQVETGHAPKPTSPPGTGSHLSSRVADNESPRPTTRGIKVAAGDVNGDGVAGVTPLNDAPKRITPIAVDPTDAQPGISDQGTAPPPPKSGDKELPGLAGEPIPGVDVNLSKEVGGIVASTKTDKTGAFHFDKLPAGKYKLIFPGLPAKSITIGTDGKTGGKVLRDGNNVIVTGDFEGSPARSQATANPVPAFLGGGFPGIGIGNATGGILPGMGPSAGGPGAGPMSPVSPIGPGAGAIRR